ncbi:MAG: monovalent cation/H+ antiporter subunit D family protein [Pseudomonadota bacterium]
MLDIARHLPVLVVVVPLLAGPICALLPAGRVPWGFATLVSWATFALAALLLAAVVSGGPISYALGGWAPPLGIEYYIDLANALVLFLVAGIAAAVFPYAGPSVADEVDHEQTALFYSALLVCFAGLLGVAATGDAFNIFVFLEISSLSTYALVAMGAKRDRRALVAAFNYLVMGTIGATFFVIGVGLLYMATGTLNLLDIQDRITGDDNRMIRAGLAFVVVGVGLKLAMFPLHLWLPNAYAFAPSAVSAFLAATATKVAVYVMVRFLFSVYGTLFEFEQLTLHAVLLPLAALGMTAASLVAVFQSDVKRLLAYSSVAQIGYMLLGLSLGSVSGLTASLAHVFNHALMKGALFMAIGCVALRLGATSCAALAGLGRRMPATTGALVIGGLSLIGVPGTVGFISKWYLLEATFEAGWQPAAFLVVASSLLAVIYVGRLLEPALLREAPAEGPLSGPVKEAPLLMLIPMWGLVAANVYFGFDASFTGGVAEAAAEQLLGEGGR